MTVTLNEVRVSYSGNGATVAFNYDYEIFAATDLKVYLVLIADGSYTEPVLNTDYSVAPLSGDDYTNGATVTFGTAPATGYRVIIINDPPAVQTADYVNSDDFPAESHEAALDRLTKLIQTLQYRLTRTMRVNDTVDDDPPDPQEVIDAADSITGIVDEVQTLRDEAEEFRNQARDAASAVGDPVPSTRTVTGAGLATNSGDGGLDANVVITVTKATEAEIKTGAEDAKAITPAGLAAGANEADGYVKLDGDGKLPAIDASNLTNVEGVKTGAIIDHAGLFIPNGYLPCDGAAVSRSTYAALFAALVASHTVTITQASPAVVSWTAHGLTDRMPIVLSTTGALLIGLNAGTTYYIKSSTADTFQLSATPGGSAINTTGTQSGVHTATCAPYGDGDGTTTFNVPELRGEFRRGWSAARAVDTNRAFGSSQGDGIKQHTHPYSAPAAEAGNTGDTPSASASPSATASNTSSNTANSTGDNESRPRNVAMWALIKT